MNTARPSRRDLLRTLFVSGSLFVAAASPLAAQTDPWGKQATLPSANTILTVAPHSADHILCSSVPWPFSYNGHVAHTTDAGQNWEVDQLDVGGVNCMFFLDQQYGWSVGGAFRHTTDGGQTWITDNDWPSVDDVFFLDRTHGWACGAGGGVYTTANGGLDWTNANSGFGNLSSIWFTDRQNGWATGPDGRIIRSTDGGQSWTLAFDSGEYLRRIQFLSPLEGWAVGGKTALHTTNGGQTWTPTPMPASNWAQNARFFDALRGITVGEGGQIVRTVDGGQTWTTVRPAGSGPRLWDVEYGDAQTIIASGDAGVLLRSTDGGLSWAQIQSGAWGITRGIAVHDAQRAWAACQGGEIVRTTDGGARWERYPVAGFSAYGSLYDIDFATDKVGWTVGREHNGSGYDGRISYSADGGLTWELQLDLSFSELLGVAAFDTQKAIAFGWGTIGGTLVRTTNGGQSWLPAGPPQGTYRGAETIDASTGWIAGTHIYKTTNAGASWQLQYTTPNGIHLAAISFADAQHGWAVGFQNQLLRTTDGGQSWVPQSSGAPAGTGLMGVSAVSPTTAWITGWNSYVARTTDGGAHWQPETLPGTPNAYWECTKFVDAERGWVAGDYGIFSRDPGGDCSGVANYCSSTPNSTGQPATIGWSGSCVASVNDFTLVASPVPDQTFLFFFGPSQVQVPFGNGLLCIGGGVTRISPAGVASANTAQRQVDLTTWGLTAGATTNFQCWFRDPAAGGALFDLSDALNATFE